MTDGQERITLERARVQYPDQWVVFAEPRTDEVDTSFIDGVVYFHSADQDAAFRKAEDVAGGVAILYTGEPKHRNVTFEPLDAIHKPAA